MSPRICYVDKTFSAAHNDIIDNANAIIETYAAEGYDLTLRQLFYQFVSRDLIRNKQSEYKRLGGIISEARRAGLIDWDQIKDRTRNLDELPTWDGPEAIVDAVAKQFRYDRWDDQPTYVEVWFEKDALEGVFERVCHELRVPFFSCRGYTSDSSIWEAGQRIAGKLDSGKDGVILHFGDHDPSGIDMTGDIERRLQMFDAGEVEIRRLALNMDQIRRYNPPPNPAKESDSRFRKYRAEHGDKSWELDALEPKVLARLVRSEVESLIDDDLWEAAIERETTARAQLTAISKHYPKVAKYVERLKK